MRKNLWGRLVSFRIKRMNERLNPSQKMLVKAMQAGDKWGRHV